MVKKPTTHWFDYKTYWYSMGNVPSRGTPPTKKRLAYVTLYAGKPTQMQLCIGVWDDDVYTELNQDELVFHQALDKAHDQN